jgi:hypothetical protein
MNEGIANNYRAVIDRSLTNTNDYIVINTRQLTSTNLKRVETYINSKTAEQIARFKFIR